MVAISGNKPVKGKRRRNIRYFFIGSDLHRVLRIVRATDLVEAWNYREGRSVAYIWSDVQKRMGHAFTLQQVCKMIGRHRVQIENYILAGNIKTPARTYSLDGNRSPGKYMFSEEDVLGVHDFLLTVHIGRPRKDGKITPGRMPTKTELRAMMRHNLVTYVKTDTDEFTPVWKEIEW